MVAILDSHGRPLAPPKWQRTREQAAQRLSSLHARYDAAQTGPDNKRHWANADSLSARSAASASVRKTLRRRARYECHENNSLGKGIILTLANDTIGTRPRLQVRTDDATLNATIEAAWNEWSKSIRLGDRLRTMRMAKAVDGESFAVITRNSGLDSPIQLDLRVVEADQIDDPFGVNRPDQQDGIRFDSFGNPVEYHLLNSHPGDTFQPDALRGQWVNRRDVLHYYRVDRPGQHRGIPEVAPALPLFADLRRYVLAVIAAAETAAEFAAVLFTDSAALSEDEIAELEALDAIDIERRMMMTLPKGWKMGQFTAQQPATTFVEFRNAIINEIARCFNMPFNVAAGNSSGYNYASGRLDHQVYHRSLDVERDHIECVVLDPLFAVWRREAAFTGLLPDVAFDLVAVPHRWFWDPHRHVDPQKEASATVMLWQNGHLTDDDIQFLRGVDPEEHYANLKRQWERRNAINAPLPSGLMPPQTDEKDEEETE